MNYQKYQDQRLQENTELADAYAEENLEREIGRQVLRLRLEARQTSLWVMLLARDPGEQADDSEH